MTKSIRALALVVPALLLSPAVRAQTDAPAPDSSIPEKTVFDGDYLTLGVGATFNPSYEGSDSYVVSPLAGFQGRLGGFTVSPRPAGLAVDLINEPADAKIAFNVGPTGRLRFDRTRNIRDPIVSALGKLNTAVELGGTVGVSINRITNPYDSLSFGVDVRWDVANAHKGRVIMPTATFSTPVSRGALVVLNVSGEIVDDNYARYYYDVTPRGSAASGLPVYASKGGLKSTTGALIAMVDLDGDLTNGGFAIGGGISYTRIMGNFADSPIIAQRGSPNQFLGGLGIAYTF